MLPRKPWIITVDLDGTLCKGTTRDKYPHAEPMPLAIAKVNKLADAGHTIIIYTARGWADYPITHQWLLNHGVHFNQLVMGKVYAHLYIDTQSCTLDEAVIKLVGGTYD